MKKAQPIGSMQEKPSFEEGKRNSRKADEQRKGNPLEKRKKD